MCTIRIQKTESNHEKKFTRHIKSALNNKAVLAIQYECYLKQILKYQWEKLYYELTLSWDTGYLAYILDTFGGLGTRGSRI